MSPKIDWANGRRESDIRVYICKRVSDCSGCGITLMSHTMKTRTGSDFFCLSCSGLGNLEFLPTGSTSVTGLAMGYTGRKILVLRESNFSYRRIGILAPARAIKLAREKSAMHAAKKAVRRAKKLKVQPQNGSGISLNWPQPQAQVCRSAAQVWTCPEQTCSPSTEAPR